LINEQEMATRNFAERTSGKKTTEKNIKQDDEKRWADLPEWGKKCGPARTARVNQHSAFQQRETPSFGNAGNDQNENVRKQKKSRMNWANY